MKKTITKIVISLLFISVLAGMLYFISKYNKKRALCYKEHYNYNNELAYFNNGKTCLMSKETDKCLSPRVDYIFEAPTDDTLAVFKLKNKRGYMNTLTGEIVIPATHFDKAWIFDAQSGLAAVVEDNKLGFINRSGQYVIPPTYAYDEWINEYKNFIFSDGFCIVPDAVFNKYGVINTADSLVLPIIYDNIYLDSYDYYILESDGLYGLADSTFNILLEANYNSIDINQQGFIISEFDETYRQYLLSKDLKTILSENVFTSVEKLYDKKLTEMDEDYYEPTYEYSESGFSKFYYGFSYGVLDNKTGKILIPAVWDDIEYYGNGLFKAELNFYYFIIDAKGKIVSE